MCGIAGIVKKENDIVKYDEIKSMCDLIVRRGPDDWGHFLKGRIGLGMRRLKVIDLEGGHQPMISDDGRYVIVFNGEVYNYIEIREELKKRGRTFKTNSDTEVVLQAYQEYGFDSVNEFRGMFAYCILDCLENTLLLVRDRLGIKPLFYYFDGETFLFSSEMKSLLKYCKKLTINNEAITNYLTLSYIPAPMSIYNEIFKLPPGHRLIWKNSGIKIQNYWDINFADQITDLSEIEVQEEFERILTESIKLRLRADVPLGAFLSGGIDSSLIVALMAEKFGIKVRTYTVGFPDDEGDDERAFARRLSDIYGTEHHEFEMRPKTVELISEIVDAFDEPFGDVSTIPTYIVSQMATSDLTVALSGLGGDELFAGYERHLGYTLSNKMSFITPEICNKILSPIVARIPELSKGNNRINHLKRFFFSLGFNGPERYLRMISLLSNEMLSKLYLGYSYTHFQNIEKRISTWFGHSGSEDPLSKVLYTDTKQYLPDDILCNTDRLSMWHSLEVRVPYLDHKLVEFCARIPAKMKIKGLSKKYLLRRYAGKYLPTDILRGKKKGFICPMSIWLERDLRDMCYDLLRSSSVREYNIFSREKIEIILEDHFSKRALNDTLIWSLLVFECWLGKVKSLSNFILPGSN